MPKEQLLAWLPRLRREVWILSLGRLLSQIGTGFTSVYATIFFVNEVGLSATQVGIALGCSSLSGVIGRFLGGSFSDSNFWGRKGTLLLSAGISAVADIFLASTVNFPLLVIGNLLMGLGIGLYWPPTEAIVADLTTSEQRNEAFGLTRLSDSLGLGLGVIAAGGLISTGGNYRALFIIDGFSFLLFFAVIYLAIQETHQSSQEEQKPFQAWSQALSDRRLLIWVLVNVLFTTYLAQIQTTLPLYFTNFVPGGDAVEGFAPETISFLFTGHIALSALLQLPVARFLNRFPHVYILMASLLLWGGGFVLIWLTGVVPAQAVFAAAIALAILAAATVTYLPSASSFVVELAPDSLRGVYFSVNSQCWALGYLIGPPLGGWALDQSATVVQSFWLGLASSVGLGVIILYFLKKSLH